MKQLSNSKDPILANLTDSVPERIFKKNIGVNGDKSIIGYKTLRQLKDYDCIELSSPIKEVEELIKYNPLIQEKSVDYKTILPEYVLKFTNIIPKNIQTTKYKEIKTIINYVYINNDQNIVECYSFERTTSSFYLVFAINPKQPSVGTNDVFSYINTSITEKDATIALGQILSILGYISEELCKVNTVVKTERLPRNNNKGSNSNNSKEKIRRRTVKVLNKDKVIYTVKSNQANISATIRKYQRHVKSWSVVGHSRRLKNGKTVWVKPYVKGKGEISPKTYKIQ